jgi:hypothetical protein
MRVYRVVMRSGANMDITAKAMRDDPECDVIYFFHDETQNILVASVQRDDLAGLIIYAQNSSAVPHH